MSESVCLNTPEYMLKVKKILFKYADAASITIPTDIIIMSSNISYAIISLEHSKKKLKSLDREMGSIPYNNGWIDDEKTYESTEDKFRDWKMLTNLSNKCINIMVNYVFESLDAKQKMDLMEELNKEKRLLCITSTKTKNNMIIGGKRTRKNRKNRKSHKNRKSRRN